MVPVPRRFDTTLVDDIQPWVLVINGISRHDHSLYVEPEGRGITALKIHGNHAGWLIVIPRSPP